MPNLTVRQVTTLKPGTYGDGQGLWLQVRESGRSWIFRFKSPVSGRARAMGLGAVANVSLAEARSAAAVQRALLQAGKDPIDERQALPSRDEGTKTFREAADAYIAANRSGWKNVKHADQWHSTLLKHAYPIVGDMPISTVGTTHVMLVLEPIWTRLSETASRLRGRLELVLDYATAKGWRTGDNPARWRGHIAHMLPKRSKVSRVVHHPALPYALIGAVMAKLKAGRGTSALAVQFVTLTAARSGEVRGATWSEIDLEAKVWTVPGERMKAGREHRVPLSAAALEVLAAAKALKGLHRPIDYVFPGGRVGKPLSDVALSNALATAAGGGFTVHGLRSTFRDWAGEISSYPSDVAEAALAHTIRDKVEAAYRRGDSFAKRRGMMDAWAAYCETAEAC